MPDWYSLVFLKGDSKAKHKEPQASSTLGKMLVMMIQLEGDSTTIQEGIRTFKEAMSRTMPQGMPRPHLPQSALAALHAPAVDGNGEAPANGEAQENVDEVEVDASSAPTSSEAAPVKLAKERKLPKMTLLKALDLRPQGKPHLKEWLAEKKPKTQMEVIAACVYYLRRVLELSGVTANHVFTCLDDTKVTKIPNHLPQVLRNTAASKGWVDVTDSNAIEITTKGINLIDHDLAERNGSPQ